MTGKTANTTRRALRVLSLCVLALAGSVMAWLALERPAPSAADSGNTTQLATLERRVATLQARVDTQALVREAMTPPDEAVWLPNYQIACAAPWRELGAMGQGLWGCQAPEPLPNGFYPNCNLTASPVTPGISAQAYWQAAVAEGKPLSSARQLAGRAVQLHRHTAYESSFEHSLTGAPLRVLSAIVVQDEHAFAVTCSAPPEAFDTFLVRFRAIIGSFDLGA